MLFTNTRVSRLSFFSALKWSMLAEFISKAVQPLVYIVLAWLLTPEDFGVVAAAIMIISFSQIFWEAGMGKALIQRQADIEEAANAAFWINLVLGLVVSSMLFVLVESITELFFHDPRVNLVIQVMSLQILLGALCSVQTALLQREMQFNRLFWVRLTTATLPGLVSIPLAWNGLSYWALVAGALVGQLLQVIVLWRSSPWRPRWVFSSTVAWPLVRFGGWVSLSGLLAWFYLWADSLIVGMYLGTHELGLYRMGNQFVMMVYGLIFAPLLPVLYSHLSNIQANRKRLRNVFLKVMRIMTFIAIPMALALYLLSAQIGDLIFGLKWQGIGMVIGIMGLAHGYAWIVGASGEVFRSIELARYETIVMAIGFILYLPCYLVSIHYGLEAFLWTRFGVALLGVLVHLCFLKKILHFRLLSEVTKIIFSLFLVFMFFLINFDVVYISKYADYFLFFMSYLVFVIVVLLLNMYDDFLKDFFKMTKWIKNEFRISVVCLKKP